MRLTPVYQGPIFSMLDFACRASRGGRGTEEQATSHHVALVRRGVYVKHTGRRQWVADSASVLFYNDAEPYAVSHPADGGDDCTVLSAPAGTWQQLLLAIDPHVQDRPYAPFTLHRTPVSPSASLASRGLRHRLQSGRASEGEVEEVGLHMLEEILRGALHTPRRESTARRSAARRRHCELVERAELHLAQASVECNTLTRLAQAVGSSPYHLARVFRATTGRTVHEYRLLLRLELAAQLLLDTTHEIGRIALDVGFSDHGHLSRWFRITYGVRPSEFRAGTTRVRAGMAPYAALRERRNPAGERSSDGVR